MAPAAISGINININIYILNRLETLCRHDLELKLIILTWLSVRIINTEILNFLKCAHRLTTFLFYNNIEMRCVYGYPIYYRFIKDYGIPIE